MSNEALNIQIAVSRQEQDVSIGIDREEQDIEFAVEFDAKVITMDVQADGHLPDYDGPYEVDASLYMPKVLGTTGHSMTGDVTVNQVPVYGVSNPAGGKTVTIGVV